MIKSLLKKWLEIPSVAVESELNVDLQRMRATYQMVFADHNNILHVTMELQKKFDVLAEAMGVVIVGQINGEDPKIVSIRDDGILGDATAYINAAQIADKYVDLQYRCLQDQAKLFAQLAHDAKK